MFSATMIDKDDCMLLDPFSFICVLILRSIWYFFTAVQLPPFSRFGLESIGNVAENWFGKIFQLVIFSQIVSQWSRLAKYYFLGLFEQLHPDFEKPINCCLFPYNSETVGFPCVCGNPVKYKAKRSDCIGKRNGRKPENKGRFPFTKKCRKFQLGCKRNTTFWFVPLEIFRNKGNFWKRSPVFPVETSQWKICVPFTEFSLLLFLSSGPDLSRPFKRPGVPRLPRMELVTNGTRSSQTEIPNGNFPKFVGNGKRPGILLLHTFWQ